MTSPQQSAGGRLELRQRRRRQRLRLVVAAVVLLAVAAAAFAVYLAADAPARPQTAVAQVRTQSTLLLQVQAPDQTAVASALLASDPDVETGAVLLVPSQVLVNVPGVGSLPLGRALSSAPPHGSRDALSDLMGVTVDEGWILSTEQLTQLVDAVGGIPVEVDVPVVVDSAVLLDVGPQRVDGARALELMQYLAPEEQEQSRLARLQEVLDGLLSSLPGARGELVTLLQTVDAEAGATLAPPALADLLLA
jgi:anionic cell wall polymer biosynthesis LytR-Cps2A-Psr (LCP) family protein